MTHADIRLMGRAMEHAALHPDDPPAIPELAAMTGLNPHQFRQVFMAIAGVMPEAFLDNVPFRQARALLEHRGRLPGKPAVNIGWKAVERPEDFGTVIYGFHETPLGRVLVGLSDHRLCWLGFAATGDAAAMQVMTKALAGADFRDSARDTAFVAARLTDPAIPWDVVVRGTPFQVDVWKALCRIPVGSIFTYGDVAAAVGRPAAVRAVGQAVGSNPVSIIVPCHRVVLGSGKIHTYGGGPLRKRILLAWEAALAKGRLQAAAA
ncbi:MAG: methylated-DNA--[protein]-cysteine S-methyltransferase [Pseudomonadota bacterium]|nr:methylated-DNA--[protein]-cysteine S-methyltransferase [Pseudomonadota bacterium]